MSDRLADNNKEATDNNSAGTPPQLSSIGLCRAHRMSKANESRRLLRSQTADKKDNELFVKLPKFSKRLRNKNSVALAASEPERDVKETISISHRLYKFLKQPNCQLWFWFEFMESFIDKAILASTYDMSSYVHSFFPELNTRRLPRRCWQMIRRSMGKARRFSTAFIGGERVELERCRRIVRQLQQHTFNMDQDGQSLELMPKHIPMPLSIDNKVVSLLSGPTLMLCKGRVVGFEPKDSSYTVKFNICGKSSIITVPDNHLYELQECKTVPLTTLVKECEEKQITAGEVFLNGDEAKVLFDALLQLKKLTILKRKAVHAMASMNEEVETGGKPAAPRRESKNFPLRDKLQRSYASNMITLHRVNSEILEPLRVAHQHLMKYENETLQRKCIPRNKLYEKCRTLAEMDMKTVSTNGVRLEPTRELIVRLQTMLYLCGEFGHSSIVEVDAIIEEFVNNMLLELPPQLSPKFDQAMQIIRPLREQILNVSLQSNYEDNPPLPVTVSSEVVPQCNDESDVEMSL